MTPLPDAQILRIAETYKLLGDPTRLRILMACLNGPVAVGDIARLTGASPSLVSHNLRLLRAARLVRGERRTRQVFYETADAHIRHMLTDIIDHTAEEQS
ncbi:MAG: metalloregulator ArsR/SmtB family transcription factor [Asticcacaulis sp.]